MEYKAATDSGVCVLAAHDGTVEYVDADKIVVRCADGSAETYELIKFMRSNQGNCINQRPIVMWARPSRPATCWPTAPRPATARSPGQERSGRLHDLGGLQLRGRRPAERELVREDVYTSIHIEEYETEARDTKLGPEEITRDIPNVGDDALKDLDDRGIIRVGAEVKTGDILVGKVTPKGETELTAEERLLRAIFGEKAREVRDTSLRCPTVLTASLSTSRSLPAKTATSCRPACACACACYIAQKRKISVGDKMAGRHGNKGVVSRILPQEDMPFLPDGTPLDIVLNPLGVPSRMNIGQVLEVNLGYVAKALGWKVQTPYLTVRTSPTCATALPRPARSGTAKMRRIPTHLDRLMGEKAMSSTSPRSI